MPGAAGLTSDQESGYETTNPEHEQRDRNLCADDFLFNVCPSFEGIGVHRQHTQLDAGV
jgi:hypothetical protein